MTFPAATAFDNSLLHSEGPTSGMNSEPDSCNAHLLTLSLKYILVISSSVATLYPYFDVVVGLVCTHDPKSYAGCSICCW
jgi:hypothetical protein